MDEYGFFQFTPDGKVIDQNLDSTLIVEGVLFLSAVPCKINIDSILPMRHYYKGGFIMPIPYSSPTGRNFITLNHFFIQDGFLMFTVPRFVAGVYANYSTTLGAFGGPRFYYGYFN